MSKFVDQFTVTDESGNCKKEININLGDPLAREQSQKAMLTSEQAKQTANEAKQIAQEAKDAVPGQVSQQVEEATRELSGQIGEAKQTADEAKQIADDTGVVDGYVKYIILNEAERAEEKKIGPCILSLQYYCAYPTSASKEFSRYEYRIYAIKRDGALVYYCMDIYLMDVLKKQYIIDGGYNIIDLNGDGSFVIYIVFNSNGYIPGEKFRFNSAVVKKANAVNKVAQEIRTLDDVVKSNHALQNAYISAITTFFQTEKKPHIISRDYDREDFYINYDTPLSIVPTMFKNTNIKDIVYLDCNGVDDISLTFDDCNRLERLYISNLIPKANGLSSAFNKVYNLKELLLINSDFSAVTSIDYAFHQARSIERIDLNFDMPNLNSMKNTFDGCKQLREIQFGRFGYDNPNSIDFYYAFRYAYRLERLNFDSKQDGVNTFKVSRASGVFYECLSIKYINWSNASFENCTSFANAFLSCNDLEVLNGMNGVKVSYRLDSSPLLTHESALNCIAGLYDLTEGGTVTEYTAQTLTFHRDVTAQLTEEEIAEATAKGWNIA